MPKRDDRSRIIDGSASAIVVPGGAPPWVTLELIEHTLRVWQPFYRDQLIPEDALEIIMGMGRMVDVLSSGGGHETIRRTGESQQP